MLITVKLLKGLKILVASALISGCASVPAKSPTEFVGYEETGKASFYAMKYQFRKTASGERFSQLSKTAAHKKLPFGTKVRVTNLKSGKSVIVKINDRGPFVKGRIIDLTRHAFSKIADTSIGVIGAKIEVVK